MLRRALHFELVGSRGRGRSKMALRTQVEEHIEQIGLKKESAIDRAKRRNDVCELYRNMG